MRTVAVASRESGAVGAKTLALIVGLAVVVGLGLYLRNRFPSGYLKARVTLRDGKTVEQTFWKDGEKKE